MLRKIRHTLRQTTKLKPKIRKKGLLLILAVSIIVTGGVVAWSMLTKTNETPEINIEGKAEDDPLVKAVKFEQKYSDKDRQNLESGDYESYQYAKFNYAENYIKAKQYEKAGAVLQEVQNNVPQDKLAADIYIYLADLAKQQGLNGDYKKYTETLIDKLIIEKRPSEAEYYKKQLEESGL